MDGFGRGFANLGSYGISPSYQEASVSFAPVYQALQNSKDGQKKALRHPPAFVENSPHQYPGEHLPEHVGAFKPSVEPYLPRGQLLRMVPS